MALAMPTIDKAEMAKRIEESNSMLSRTSLLPVDNSRPVVEAL